MSKTITLKKKIILYLIIVAIFTNVSFAANNYSCQINMVPNRTQLNQGETVVYEIKASQINAGNGILLFQSLIIYDANVFDCRIESDDNREWNMTGFVDNYLTMARSSLTGSSNDQTIAKVALTAKTNVASSIQTVGLKNISLTVDGDESFRVQDVSTNITVGTIADNNNNSSNNGNNNGGQVIYDSSINGQTLDNGNNNSGQLLNNDNNNSGQLLNNNNNNNGQLLNNSNNQGQSQNNNNETSTKKSTNKNKESNTDIPQTGTNEAVLMIVLILIVGITIVFYKKYSNLRDI